MIGVMTFVVIILFITYPIWRGDDDDLNCG